MSDDQISYTVHSEDSVRPSSTSFLILKHFLRFTCLFVVIACPWANFKLIQFFKSHLFYKNSSLKWYIIHKAVFDTMYMLISIPIIGLLTFNIDVIHKNLFTCKFITYLHYLADDLITMMLTLACVDRMLRITCNLRLQTRFSLIICIVVTCLFALLNIHHIIRLQHSWGFCHKTYFGIWDYDYDIYYSLVYTSITWFIMFVSSLNLTVSVYCDRARRTKLNQSTQQNQQVQIDKGKPRNGRSYAPDSDRLELIHNSDDWEDSTSIIIESNHVDTNRPAEQEQQDNAELQLTVGVLITSAIFLLCNLPNFIIFVMRFVLHSSFTAIGSTFIHIALFPLLIAHTVSYFIFNHLLARCFRNNF
ncbi:unnamed protein product [Adineta ricciae]|uniref:G-protein coupled receptors family 1 profile domain-containing protein n=1 Tax=Adineta ricciae TaxID=249248 RepID=A0A815N9J0_ADIRI|nr:unnamed protein product [Adineta ricciae]